MFSVRVIRKFRTVLATFVIGMVALASLAPAISHALGYSPVAHWVELCSAQGMKRIAVNASGEPVSPAEQAMQHAEHCPFCHVEHSPATLPPALASFVPQAEMRSAMPQRFYAAPHASHAWVPALSRGPPVVS